MKQKQFNRSTCYKIVSVIIIAVLAFTFAFPLYWIIIGSFKTSAAINATTPQWWPQEWVLDNYRKLFSRQFAALWDINIPFTNITFSGPEVPAAIRWLLNTVFMALIRRKGNCFTTGLLLFTSTDKLPGFQPGSLFFYAFFIALLQSVKKRARVHL